MSDIVVTIPKNRLNQVAEEERITEARRQAGEQVYYFWSLNRRPKDLAVGDRCYFVWANAIRAYHVVVGFAEDQTCEVTNIHHPGLCVMLDPEIHEVEPIPHQGFRGYRYMKRRS